MRLIVLKNSVPINDVTVETPDSQERYEIFVGRAEDCYVIIDDPLISRHHFVITNEGSTWYCEKLTKLGIVSINGQIATKTPIKDGDEIKCGPYSVLVAQLSTLSTPIPENLYPASEPSALPEVDETIVFGSPLATPAQNPETQVMPDDLGDDLGVSMDLEELPSDLDQDFASDFATPEENDFDDLAPDDDVLSLEEPGDDLGSLDDFQDDPLADSGNDFQSDNQFEDAADMSFEDPAASEEMSFGDSTSIESFDDQESTRFLKAFVNYQLVLFGDHAPYDRFQIDQDEIFIGRDSKKCQIVLNDPEVSTVHAVIRKNNADVSIEDLNSSNGTILNGGRINKARLNTGDEFVIGSTSFSLEVRSDLLEAESSRLMPVASGQVVETEEIHEEEVTLNDFDKNFTSDDAEEKSIIKRVLKDPEKRKRALMFLVVGLLAWVLLDPEEPEETAQPDAKKEAKVEDQSPKKKVQLTKELEQKRNIAYELGVSFFEQNKYFEALKEFQVVIEIDPGYKNVQTYFEQTKVGLKRLEELEAQKRADEEKIKVKKLIEELLVKAREAVKEKQVVVAENYFSQIVEKDPENLEVQQLKMELEAWQKEQERVALENAVKDAARKAMVDALQPGKTFYLKKEWYRAILKLEEFLRRKGTDEDLIKEGSEMLSDSKDQLAAELGPLIGKARSLKEGQDLKNAYEAFLDVLKVEPTNTEALNEVDEIKSILELKSKRIYREAIIAESLSLFNDAKEKYEEVKQISPTDSEYYRKAEEKLKDYLE